MTTLHVVCPLPPFAFTKYKTPKVSSCNKISEIDALNQSSVSQAKFKLNILNLEAINLMY